MGVPHRPCIGSVPWYPLAAKRMGSELASDGSFGPPQRGGAGGLGSGSQFWRLVARDGFFAWKPGGCGFPPGPLWLKQKPKEGSQDLDLKYFETKPSRLKLRASVGRKTPIIWQEHAFWPCSKFGVSLARPRCFLPPSEPQARVLWGCFEQVLLADPDLLS